MIDGGWKYAAASVIGTSHQTRDDSVCQDCNACAYIEAQSTLVSIVSDGAGSAAHSEVGSKLTCEYVLRRVKETDSETLLTRPFAEDVLAGLRGELLELAEQGSLKIREFACTMLVAIVQNERAAFWQIGDGAMCFRVSGEDHYNYAFWPEKGDFANVTFFVTDDHAADHLEFDAPECQIIELAVFSDGLERLALDFVNGEVHAAFFRGLLPYLNTVSPGPSPELSSQLDAFLSSERVNARTDDDKTLVLASRLG
jgi:hypothetical protein